MCRLCIYQADIYGSSIVEMLSISTPISVDFVMILCCVTFKFDALVSMRWIVAVAFVVPSFGHVAVAYIVSNPVTKYYVKKQIRK